MSAVTKGKRIDPVTEYKSKAIEVQKEFYYGGSPQMDLWDNMWSGRKIEEEWEACDLETPARDLFLAYLPKEGKAMDGGCGFGKWVIYLKRRGYNIVGIDNNQLAINKLRDFDSSLQVELGDILDIHYPDNSFDAYISMGVVEHFEEGPGQALKEAHRVLKPGGLIFVSVPAINPIRKFLRRPLRIIINALPMSYIMLRSTWSKSKRNAILAAAGTMASILPERIKRILARVLLGQKSRFYHFLEYRYSISEVKDFMKESGFEIIEVVTDDFYGSKDHAVGLVVDFPFLGSYNGVNFKLNPIGKLVSLIFNSISPQLSYAMVLCVGKCSKAES